MKTISDSGSFVRLRLRRHGPAAAPETWPQFRGPGAAALPKAPNLPERWSETENVAWKIAVPGTGWSSPIVVGDRVFVTSVVSASETEKPTKGLYFGGERPASTRRASLGGHRRRSRDRPDCCGRATRTTRCPPFARHLKNSYASETPVTDGERVYVLVRQRRPVLLRPRRQAAVVAEGRADADAQRLGHRGLTGPARRPALSGQRQRSAVVRHGARREDGQDTSGACRATKAATGRRRSSGSTTAARSS